MGFLDDAASVISGAPTHHSRRSKSHRSSRHKDRSRSKSDHRSRSRSRHRSGGGGGGGSGPSIAGVAASVFGLGGGDDHDDERRHRKSSHSKHKRDHSASRSFFGSLAGGDYGKHNASRSSFFSGFGGGAAAARSSPSYYKRSPRPNFLARLLKRLKRLLRDLIYWAKRHPMKVFMLVIMPLITGGALTALLAKFGLRLPATLTSMVGLAGKAATGDGIGLVGEVAKMATSAGAGGGGGAAAAATKSFSSSLYEKTTISKDGVGGFGLGSLGDLGKLGGSLVGGAGGLAKMFS